MNHRVPKIVDTLLANGGENIRRYFQGPGNADRDGRIWGRVSESSEVRVDKWIEDFKKKAHGGNLDHQEPWVTLVALYGLFGDQKDLDNRQHLESINYLLSDIFGKRYDRPAPPKFDRLVRSHMEVYLPENLKYRKYVQKEIFKDGPYHLYRDRKQKLEEKLEREKASFEGNTNLDGLISGKSDGRHIHVFIEAKFLSDISKDITYVSVRNQIARNIDCAMWLMTKREEKDLEGLKDFWFLLLTPGIFRTEKYGGPVYSPIRAFVPERSRLFCYKMDDYLNPDLLRRDLPHWEKTLDRRDWDLISSRIGWLTYEEIVSTVKSKGGLTGASLEDFKTFFRERSLMV
jgi:hypothetical protein